MGPGDQHPQMGHLYTAPRQLDSLGRENRKEERLTIEYKGVEGGSTA